MSRSQKKILVFLLLTFGFSAVFYFLGRSVDFSSYSLAFAFCPGASALLTQWLFQHSLRGLGWQRAKLKDLLLSYGLPVVLMAVVYGLAWLTGLAGFDPFSQSEFMARELGIGPHSPTVLLALDILVLATVGVAVSLLWALGEEIGWRGLLVPELYRRGSFLTTALISGVIWALWRMPEVLFFNYRMAGSLIPFAAACFVVYSLGISFAYTWLRLKTGSVWPCTLFNASLGVFSQQVFDSLVRPVAATSYVINPYGGVGMALAAVGLACLFWRRRNELPGAGWDTAVDAAASAAASTVADAAASATPSTEAISGGE